MFWPRDDPEYAQVRIIRPTWNNHARTSVSDCAPSSGARLVLCRGNLFRSRCLGSQGGREACRKSHALLQLRPPADGQNSPGAGGKQKHVQYHQGYVELQAGTLCGSPNRQDLPESVLLLLIEGSGSTSSGGGRTVTCLLGQRPRDQCLLRLRRHPSQSCNGRVAACAAKAVSRAGIVLLSSYGLRGPS